MTKKTTSSSRFRPNSDRVGLVIGKHWPRGALLRAAVLAFGAAVSVVGPADAQNTGQAISEIVTVDRQRLFSDTMYGRRVIGTIEAERLRLAAETRKVEQDLVREEQDLTEKRDAMEPDEFRALARAFDEKVKSLRLEGTAREQEFVQTLEREQAAFYDQISPILRQLVTELGAVVIIDHRAILLSTINLDITNRAVQRIDSLLGDGAKPLNGDNAENTGTEADEEAESTDTAN